jgi:hypothetical protein
MGIKDFIEEAKHAGQLLKGEESKDTTFSSTHTYTDVQTATQAFANSKERLFQVEAWSAISALSSTFTLYDAAGKRKKEQPIQLGDYICIQLPGPLPENWVRVVGMHATEAEAEFTVSPSESPMQQEENQQQIKHFFTQQASSTFRVKQEGNTISGWEIGKNEVVNNKGAQAGDRSVVNTLVAAGGWALFQKIQWQMLTDYFVGT